MVYDLARLSFSKASQKTLMPEKTDKDPIDIVEKLLMSNKSYIAPRNRVKRAGETITQIRRGYIDLVLRNFLVSDDGKKKFGRF